MRGQYLIPSLFLLICVCPHYSHAAFQADLSFRPEVAKPAFTAKHPVVIFDQGHLNVASKDGRYAPIIHLLESDGLEVLPSSGKITSALLARGQILYISGAQGSNYEKASEPALPAFSEGESQVIESWVKSGGSMLLLSDHTTIGDSIHPLAALFGVQISSGETDDQNNYLAALRDASHLLFTDENHLIAKHPVTYGRNDQEKIHRVAVFSGQSVLGPQNSKPILTLAKTAENYFEDGSRKPVGEGFAEAVSFHYGKGRVIIFGDATVFTSKIETTKKQNEGMNRSDIDNVKLATNAFRWLAGLLDD
jgi:hypothetical protein